MKLIYPLFFFLLLIGSGTLYGQTIRYVKSTATGTGDGSSWTNASANLQGMINASVANDEVWVAAGTYLPTEDLTGNTSPTKNQDKNFHLSTDIKLYGGFSGNGTETLSSQASPTTNITILSGDFNGDDVVTGAGSSLSIANNLENASNVMAIDGLTTAARLDGFSIIRGYALDGGGSTNGSAINILNSSMTIANCTFFENRAYNGSLFANSSSPTLTNCIFYKNKSDSGGGIYFNNCLAPKLNNCLFYDNRAFVGGCIYNAGSHPTLRNCTFYNNVANNNGSISNNYSSSSILQNCILWQTGNSVDNIISNSIIKDSGGSSNWNTTYGTDGGGNLDANPLFQDVTNRNFTLASCSPAINIGNNNDISAGITTDLANQPRIFNSTVDMGAYEFQGLTGSFFTVFVKKSATGNNDGTSWANAYTNLQDALNNSCSNQIWVAAGTYYPTTSPDGSTTNIRDKAFYLNEDKQIYGGFNGTETLLSERNPATNPTILSGDFNNDDVVTGSGNTLSFANNSENAYHVMVAVDLTAAAVLNGFTIKGASANGSGSIFYSSQTIGRNWGGGLHNASSSLTITNCVFINNATTGVGGGLTNSSSTSILTNCLIINNVATWGGGVHARANISLINCTIYGNLATNTGGGVRADYFTPTITNSIIWGNGSNNLTNDNATPIISNSIIGGSGGSSSWDNTVGTNGGGNLDTDPLFVNAADPDGADNIWFTADDGLFLVHGSPALNVGNDAANSTTTDAAGNARKQGIIDLGAYEGSVAPLPVELIYFKGESTTKGSLLTWQTASEENNKGFEVQRSSNGEEWEVLGFVEGNGTTLEVQNYTYTDEKPLTGINYYRLKQMDYDGQFEYTHLVMAKHGTVNETVEIFPNPVIDRLTIVGAAGQTTIYNMLGQPVKQFTIRDKTSSINVSDLLKGQYILHIQQENGTVTTKRFVK